MPEANAETIQSKATADASDQRLIEAGFPCHQVGSETQRERGASSALPPLYFLHVWWARRPLVPSRAAVLASLLPADTDTEAFIQSLGIVRYQAVIGEGRWILAKDIVQKRIEREGEALYLPVDKTVLRHFEKEQARREKRRSQIARLKAASPELSNDPVIAQWERDVQPLPATGMYEGGMVAVEAISGDPAGVREKIEFAKRDDVKEVLGGAIQWDPEDSYAYSRAFATPISPLPEKDRKVVLDPTAGGGSIPFEALRLGHHVIANELNPVASVILQATLDYPFRYGAELLEDIQRWGQTLRSSVESQMAPFTPFSPIPQEEKAKLKTHLKNHPDLVEAYSQEHDHMGLLYCRQVRCPNCEGDAPLLNSLWLSKEDNDRWGVKVQPQSGGTVRFAPFEVTRDTPAADVKALDKGTVTRAVGQCVHCHQAIDGDEIKRQARGESEYGQWQDRLYAVVGIRLTPKKSKHGAIQVYASGPNQGEVKTEKVRYFRAPNEQDLQALQEAEAELERRRMDFEMQGLVPNEPIPSGSKTGEPLRYGMATWADMFTPRQLLGHLTAMEALNKAKRDILKELGPERGRAVVTYLQYAIDKIVDYNSRQTLWIPQRGSIGHTFSRKDFSFKWTFGEMIYAGPSSGFRWGLSQALDSFEGIARLARQRANEGISGGDLQISNGSATDLQGVADKSVDTVIMDPPYYDNVQYNELSDFFYVWQKRTLGDLHPGWFESAVTDKTEEAVANPVRDGSSRAAKARYQALMEDIFLESKRVLKHEGIMTLMFTHKSQDAWETLVSSLVESGWAISSSFPVDSEYEAGFAIKDKAAAVSSIFVSCRPFAGDPRQREASSWVQEVKGPLEAAVREGLAEFEQLNLNPVDRMIASWGRALRVYSEHWPVLEGDAEVPPTRAMQEAARVVAEEEVARISGGQVTVEDLDGESRLAVIALGINGLGAFAFDDALQMSKSLNLALQHRAGNYRVDPETVVYNNETDPDKAAPLAKKGSKLRLLAPEERNRQRLDNPQTLWDVLNGLVVQYREGGVVTARNYLTTNGYDDPEILRGLLRVWADECGDEDLRREARLIDYEL